MGDASDASWFDLEGVAPPAEASTTGADACDGAEDDGGWVERMQAGAVLGPGSSWFLFCRSSEKASCKLTAPADFDNPKP